MDKQEVKAQLGWIQDRMGEEELELAYTDRYLEMFTAKGNGAREQDPVFK